MDAKEGFLSAWKLRFPQEEPPPLSCFEDDDQLKGALELSRQKVEKLQKELHKQEFIANFLWDVLHGRERKGSEPGSRGDSEWDLPVPVVGEAYDESKFGRRLYKDGGRGSSLKINPSGQRSGVHASSTNHVRAQWSARPSSRAFDETDVHNSIDTCGSRGQTRAPPVQPTSVAIHTHVNTHDSFSGARSGRQDRETASTLPNGNKLSTFQSTGKLTKSNSFGTWHGNVSDRDNFCRTDSQKARIRPVLQKAYSEDSSSSMESFDESTGERKGKPPKPAPRPRPSTKGPLLRPLRNRASNSSDSTPVNDPTIVGNEPGSLRKSSTGNVVYIEKKSGTEHSDNKLDTFGGKFNRPVELQSTPNAAFDKSSAYANVEIKPPSELMQVFNRRLEKNSESEHTGVDIGSRISSISVTDEEKLQSLSKMRLSHRIDSCEENTSMGSNSANDLGKRDVEEKVYDEPVPVNKEEVEESSSDDEEPIYYNILLMKQHSLNKVSIDAETIYASVDMQKKQLEKRARRLSNRFSVVDHHDGDKQQGPERIPSCVSEEAENDSFEVTGPLIETSSISSDQDSVFLYPTDESPHIPQPIRRGNAVNESAAPWKKRTSMIRATEGSVASESDELDMVVPTCSDTEKKLQMRKWVVTSILDSEHNYVDMLGVLLQYMRSFQAAASTSQSVISVEDIKTIFFKIPELHEIHSKFIHELEPKVESWSAEQEVAEAFKMMALEEYPVASDYLKNYQNAVATIHRCSQENPYFVELTKEIKTQGMNERPSLEEYLHKPVVRIQRNTLVLHDLIQCTPTSHADYDVLQKTLKITQHFLDNFQSPINTDNTEHQRYLVKNTLVVERVGNKRKLRHVFLFNDVIVCTKQKISGSRRLHFECKWFIPLAELSIDPKSSTQEEKQLEESRRQEIEVLNRKISQLQSDLRSEVRRNKVSSDSQSRSWSIRGTTRNIDKIKKKLVSQEAALLLASPHLIFRLKNKQNKTFTLLLSSDYERNDWVETIKGLKTKVHGPSSLVTVELQNLINSLQLPKVDAISSILDKEDWDPEEEQLFGALNVTIHRLQGLKNPSDVVCCIEVDSYKHFFLKAKTNTICATTDPKWNEEFEIELDAAQTLRILCYRQEGDRDVLLGKCALELSKAWLRGEFQEKTISLNEGMNLTISLRYASRDQTIKRTPSSSKGGLFGVRISSVAKREGTKIPLIVTSCVEEVERRGLEDLGIYRVSGVFSEIQRLKKAFERNSKGAIPLARETEINCITGLLKMYFRELPEALFTDALYLRFLDGMNLSDPEAKVKCMVSLIKELPECNYATAVYIIDHLVRVSRRQESNKMSLHNIATVFGPTLLRPAVKDQVPVSMDVFSAGARDAMMQTSILYFFLSLRVEGVEF